MVDRKLFIVGLVLGILLGGLSACNKQPVACFNTTPAMDSIHINQPVIFDATCSINAGSYNWQFYDNTDSVNFTPVVTKVFKDTGTVNVYLLIVSGNNYAGDNVNITVLP